MWSVGAILFELLNGYPPFHGRSNVQVSQYLPQNGKFLLKFLCSLSQLKTWFFFCFFFNSRFWKLSRNLNVFRFLHWSVISCPLIALTCVLDCCLSFQVCAYLHPMSNISSSMVLILYHLSVCREKIVLWCVLWSWLFEEREHKDLKLNKTSSWLQS